MRTLVQTHVVAQGHLAQWVHGPDLLSAVMGVVKSSAGRHLNANKTNLTPVRTVVDGMMMPNKARQGGHLPTMDGVLRSNGELKGALLMLGQAIYQGRAKFNDETGAVHTVEPDQIEALVPGIALWSEKEHHQEYRARTIFVPARKLPEDGDDYHNKVVGEADLRDPKPS